MKRFLLLLVGFFSFYELRSQPLSQADYVQFQNQTAYLLTQEYYASFKTLIPAQGSNYEVAKSKLVGRIISPNSKIWSEYTNQMMPFQAYLADFRSVNQGVGAFRIQGNSYQREVSTQLIGGDSLVTKVYAQQVTQDIRGTRTTPIAITLTARLGRDAQNQLGYFYNLRIIRIETGSAPANAVPFSSDIQDKKNPFSTFLAEQTLSVVLDKLTNELVKALPINVSQLGVSGFTYKNCDIHDVFSTEMLATVQTDIPTTRPGLQAGSMDKAGQGYQVKGSYEEAGNFFNVSADLLDPAGSVIKHIENTDLPLSWFAANRRAFIPAEYTKINTENKTIEPKLISDDRQLSLAINTGRTTQIFYKGETMDLKIRTNKPAYVRALYRDADNNLVWLGDRKVESGEVNMDVSLRQPQECTPPFGVERLIVVASTEEMCALDINPATPYLVNIYKGPNDTPEQAVNKALFDALANSGERKCSRGMKPAGSPYKAIKQAIITTKDKVL